VGGAWFALVVKAGWWAEIGLGIHKMNWQLRTTVERVQWIYYMRIIE
jgi:hypothetical protein